MIRELEAPDLAREGAGERAFFAAEQLALDQRGRDGAAVDAHHGTAAPRAPLVDLRREQLLAGAGLAEEQHRRVGRRHLLDLIDDATHRGTLADDRVKAEQDRRVALNAQPVERPVAGERRQVVRLGGADRKGLRYGSRHGKSPVKAHLCISGSSQPASWAAACSRAARSKMGDATGAPRRQTSTICGRLNS